MKRHKLVVFLTAIALALSAQDGRAMSLNERSSASEQAMSIDDLFAALEQNNTALKAQRTAAMAAAEGVVAAKRQRLPDVSTSLTGSYYGNVVLLDRDFTNPQAYRAPHYGNAFTLQAEQAVYTGGALSAGVRMAELQKELADHTISLTRQQERFLAVGYFLDLYTLSCRQQVVQANIALTERLVENIQAKHEQGMALKNDITRYELQLAQLLLQLRKLQDMQRVKSRELAVLIGLDNEDVLISPLLPEGNFSASPLTSEAAINSGGAAFASSPQIQLATVGAQVAEQGLRLAKSELLPKVGVFATESFNGPITFELPAVDKNLNVWLFGVGLKWNVSALYKHNRKVQQARLTLEQRREQLTLAEEQVGNAVFAAHTDWEQSLVNLDTQRKSVLLARQNYEVVSERYLNELSLITDMLDASNIRLNAELQEVDALVNIIYQYYRTLFAAGRL